MISQAIRCLFFILLIALVGCDAGPIDLADEQKDPHYLNGRALSRSQDYKGAAEEFERALESNPRNASAHFELGWLNEEQLKDYAAAIYHYQQHLKLRPESDYAQRAKDRIRACKMDLVKSEVLAPVNQGIQRDLERLTAENLLLKRQIEGLLTQLQQATQVASQPVTPLPSAPLRESDRRVSPQARVTPLPTTTLQTQRPRTHTVRSGETMTAIASKYGISVNVLMSANRGVKPAKLRVGQTLNIPQR